MPGEIKKKKGIKERKKMKREIKGRKEGNFALLLVDKLARPAQKKKKNCLFFFPLH